jgi:DNA recombination protein RmuC
LLGDRVRKLQTHFNQANEDIRQSIISIDKIETHGERIQQVELGAELAARPVAPNSGGLPGNVRRLEAGE